MQVLKFGGTSVGNAANILKVIGIVSEAALKDRTVVVASAIGGITDKLISAGRSAAGVVKGDSGDYNLIVDEIGQLHQNVVETIFTDEERVAVKRIVSDLVKDLRDVCNGIYKLRELSLSSLDLVMSYGELLSTRILAAKLNSMGMDCKWVDSRNLIKTVSGNNGNIVESDVTKVNINNFFSENKGKLFVMQGFIATDISGRVTTLGRGGSDFSAALVAAAADARVLEIWTDVNGMMTADPRMVPKAQTIEHISYKEALELSHFGAKVVYPPTIQPVVKKGIPILVKNTFSPDSPGTIIEQNPPEEQNSVRGISSSNKLALLSMEGSGMVGIPGYSSRLFDVLARNNINIILITQASSVHTMLVAIDEKDADKAKRAVDDYFEREIYLGKLEPLNVEKGFSIVSLVGDNMKNQSGASGRMFEALGRCGINIRAIAQGSSERNVSAVIATRDIKEALNAVHKEFFTSYKEKVLNLFIVGYGNVARELVGIIDKHDNVGYKINVCAICNSRKMLFSKEGLSPDLIEKSLGSDMKNEVSSGKSCFEAEEMDLDKFVNRIISFNLIKPVFVDCTSAYSVAGKYVGLLDNGFHIVTCSKIANSSGYSIYEKLREVAGIRGVRFIYNTNVGAALPIISTLQQISGSSDEVLKIEAMVSGSLNYIFSRYFDNPSDEEVPRISFSKIVESARALGYTEPDPATDLSGTDLLRKAVILAREIGLRCEQEEVVINGFLPEFDGSDYENKELRIRKFFDFLEGNEDHFSSERREIAAVGNKLRFMAVIEDGKVRIGAEQISRTHPFFNLTGTDAAVAITTRLYPSPVVIYGAGAGARITAGGVFSGILQCLV